MCNIFILYVIHIIQITHYKIIFINQLKNKYLDNTNNSHPHPYTYPHIPIHIYTLPHTPSRTPHTQPDDRSNLPNKLVQGDRFNQYYNDPLKDLEPVPDGHPALETQSTVTVVPVRPVLNLRGYPATGDKA